MEHKLFHWFNMESPSIVMGDAESNVLMVWCGGTGVHVITLDGQEVDYWQIGTAATNATHDEVVTSMKEHLHYLRTGEYEEDE
jgi:hypothetical protein